MTRDFSNLLIWVNRVGKCGNKFFFFYKLLQVNTLRKRVGALHCRFLLLAFREIVKFSLCQNYNIALIRESGMHSCWAFVHLCIHHTPYVATLADS